MEYCKYCGEKRDIIEISVNECVCKHSSDGRHSYTTQGYEAGYAFGYKYGDKIFGAVLRGIRTFFRKPQNVWGIVWRVAIVLLILFFIVA